MLQLLLLCFLLAIIWYGLRELFRKTSTTAAAKIRKAMFWVVVLAFLALAATGRLGWVLPLLGALIAALLRLAPLLAQVLIPLLRRRGEPPGEDWREPHAQREETRMSREEAYQILGLEPNAEKREIIAAHRRLMQKMHPDRGGSDYLAGKINRARDVLLG